MNTEAIVSKDWSFRTTLRDGGVGHGDYLEQLTYLIFLKMADEYGQPPYNLHSARKRRGFHNFPATRTRSISRPS